MQIGCMRDDELEIDCFEPVGLPAFRVLMRLTTEETESEYCEWRESDANADRREDCENEHGERVKEKVGDAGHSPALAA